MKFDCPSERNVREGDFLVELSSLHEIVGVTERGVRFVRENEAGFKSYDFAVVYSMKEEVLLIGKLVSMYKRR